MCGNFGLLVLGQQLQNQPPNAPNASCDNLEQLLDQLSDGARTNHGPKQAELDASIHMEGLEMERLGGLKLQPTESQHDENQRSIAMSPLAILKAQTTATEIRGGQAGGFSSMVFNGQQLIEQKRVRCVARKRHSLAADLAGLYLRAGGVGGVDPSPTTTATMIGHTRFATSSINKESELHPHEWTPFQSEPVWSFDGTTGVYQRSIMASVGIHLSHNGDFDALEAFSHTLVVDEVGLFLERVLHVPNDTKGTYSLAPSLPFLSVILS